MGQLGPYEQWMVRSNLDRIASGEAADETVATLRANGYERVAAAVEKVTRAPGMPMPSGAEERRHELADERGEGELL